MGQLGIQVGHLADNDVLHAALFRVVLTFSLPEGLTPLWSAYRRRQVPHLLVLGYSIQVWVGSNTSTIPIELSSLQSGVVKR